MGVFAYTRETFKKVLNDVRISYYTHRLNAQALWKIDRDLFSNNQSNNYQDVTENEKTFLTFKFWLESIKETIFAYTLPIFHVIKLPIFLTVAAFSEVFNGLKSDFNYFFRRNKNNTQGNTDINFAEVDRISSSGDSNQLETKDYFVNESIKNYFKPQLITLDFSRVNDSNWDGVLDEACKSAGFNTKNDFGNEYLILNIKNNSNKKEFKI